MRVLSARGSELEREFPFGVVRQLFEPPLTDGEARERWLAGAAAPARAIFDAADSQANGMADALRPWESSERYLNYEEGERGRAAVLRRGHVAALCARSARSGPRRSLFLANHEIKEGDRLAVPLGRRALASSRGSRKSSGASPRWRLKALLKANWSLKPSRAAISLIDRSLKRSRRAASSNTRSRISCLVVRPAMRVSVRDSVPCRNPELGGVMAGPRGSSRSRVFRERFQEAARGAPHPPRCGRRRSFRSASRQRSAHRSAAVRQVAAELRRLSGLGGRSTSTRRSLSRSSKRFAPSSGTFTGGHWV